MAKVVVTQGMQFGSEGKGQISGMIAHQWRPDVVVCANHPNAGHTYNNLTGHKFVHRILPVGAAESPDYILIGPGAVIDLIALRTEIDELAQQGRLANKTLVIHPNAAVVLPEHRESEKKFVKIGSTMKGSAEAVIQKMRRDIDNRNTFGHIFNELYNTLWEDCPDPTPPIPIVYDARVYDDVLRKAQRILVEGAQGFSLGIHERFYPYGTSRDVSTHQVLADCRIPFNFPVYVHGVARFYPIRVANRFNEAGEMIGTSGPFYPDQIELKWEDIGRKPELTTVTKLPRRIFTFSATQIREAARIMGVHGVSLTFADYALHSFQLRDLVGLISEEAAPVHTLSMGPAYGDVYRVPHTALASALTMEEFANHLRQYAHFHFDVHIEKFFDEKR